ncbi:MAG: PorT family protein [Bacteroidales bacterium]|nr:PorT family protein [Bacteroidales bacterium]
MGCLKTYLKIILSVALVLMVPMTSFGQQISINGGLSLASLSIDLEDESNAPDTKMKAGFHVGAKIAFPIAEKISLQTGLSFTQKGYASDLDEWGNGFEVDGYERHTFAYLELPVQMVYLIQNFRFFGGPYLGIGIAGRNNWNYTITYQGNKETESGEMKIKPFIGTVEEGDLGDDESAYNGLDIGGLLGVGYKLGPVLLGASYSHGFSNIIARWEYENDDNNDYRKNNKLRNSVIQIFLSIPVKI